MVAPGALAGAVQAALQGGVPHWETGTPAKPGTLQVVEDGCWLFVYLGCRGA